ncbi:aldo/keto reductase [Rhizobium sp. LjRoot254]|uniref:aldo/keto reductase n=1 Tax=Rhizobium sp. LjRoot254 TaxID=3342297 RepID=UPI003ECC8FD0
MKTREIGKTGVHVTEIGFGTAPVAGLYRAVDEESAQAVLQAAWDSGVRYFDTAPHYGAGLAEERVGRFLKDKSGYVISTKVGRLHIGVPEGKGGDYGFVGAYPVIQHCDYSGAGIEKSLEVSSKRLGMDRFDIVFVHDIGPYTHAPGDNERHLRAFRESGIRKLNDLKSNGVIKGWGLGVNEVPVIMDIMSDTHLDVILMAGRYTLLDRSAEAELLPLCRKRGTSFVIGGVFNSGILATGPVEGATFDYMEAKPDVRAKVAAMEKIAKDAGTDLASAALHFPFQEPVVASVLLGTAKASSLQRNLVALEKPFDASIYPRFEPHVIR